MEFDSQEGPQRSPFVPAARHRWGCFDVLRFCSLGLLSLVSGCQGPQSALDPAGKGASDLANLFWVMAVGGAVIWLIVVGLGVYSLFRPESGNRKKAAVYIIGGGVIFPTLILAVLLSYGLSMLPQLVAPPPEGSLRISVTGYQWWWRIHYYEGSQMIELANEIHLPVDEPVEFILTAGDVIHSFWIPSLGGKVDMIPGRQNRLTLYPTRTGTFRGSCAEFCGTSHALMSFDVVVEERAAFERWLAHQAAVAAPPTRELEAGHDLFLANGCGACHALRGTSATGSVAPDLTHVGSRLSLAAGTLRNEPSDFRQWLSEPSQLKPDALMPHFSMLPASDLQKLASYMESLR